MAKSAVAALATDSVAQGKSVSRFMKGMFKLRPISSKYARTWGVDAVLSVIKAWVPLESLKLDKLIEKLVILLTIEQHTACRLLRQ